MSCPKEGKYYRPIANRTNITSGEYKLDPRRFTHKAEVQTFICSKIVRHPLQNVYESSYPKNLIRLANIIICEPHHVLNNEFTLLPSNRRFKVPRYNRIRAGAE